MTELAIGLGVFLLVLAAAAVIPALVYVKPWHRAPRQHPWAFVLSAVLIVGAVILIGANL